ncbi:MAG: hypothetical protein KDN19_02500 [Verrucomicrobiae bacterium]|nr:hypothetical protein [Verrucomicrobiae bacterium]
MSGIIGHVTYAILAEKAAAARRLPVVPLIRRHFATYLTGAYLGCDIQTVPAAICVDTGQGVGHGTQKLERSPLTGGPVKPWTLSFDGREITPREIQDTFYGRSHLILGWSPSDAALKIPLSGFLDYLADAAGDAVELFGPGHHALAYVLGWLTHVTGDGLIKAVIQGIHLDLIDGQYTATNRPVQDLISFNDIGRDELRLDWPVLLGDLVNTPVESVQAHYMRCAQRQGRLGAHVPDGWRPELEPLLRSVMAENRRHQSARNPRLIRQYSLDRGASGQLTCDPELSRTAGGLTYPEMREAAEKADFRQALWQIGEIIADSFEKVIHRQERLQELPINPGPTWQEITRHWAPDE